MTHPADFLHSDFPAAQNCALDITGPDRFLNRELSWLAFNWRVLEEVDSLPVSNASAFCKFSIAVGTSSNPSAETANLACFCASATDATPMPSA